MLLIKYLFMSENMIIENLKLKNRFTNASGIFSDHPFLLQVWEEAGIGGLVTKSITLVEKKPNFLSYDMKSL